MSFLAYFLILHLCVSLHACSSRPLSVFHKQPGKESPLVTSKTPEPVCELQAGAGRNIVNEDNVEHNESKLEFPSNERKTSTTHKETDMKVQISQEGNKIEGRMIRGRSMKESTVQDSKSKETIKKSKDNSSVTEDVVVMDYAQPHRKPPIHNIQP